MTVATASRTRQFSRALIWLFCILCILVGIVGNRDALAQGTVSVSVSTSVSQVTVGVGTAASFNATASATVTPDEEWSVQSGPTYSWSATPSPASCNPTDQATTTVSATYNTAGAYSTQVTCTTSYVMVKSDPGDPSDGSTAKISGTSPSVTVNIYVIGGPITGNNDIRYFCDPSESTLWGHLSAASGQPTGTTYSWSISGNAQLVQDSAYPSPADAAYAGKHPGSMQAGDVTATVTYSLNGVSIVSPKFSITVHAPVSFAIISKTPASKLVPPSAGAYGFTDQSITFKVLDGLGLPLKGNVFWDESWQQPNGGGVPAQQGGVQVAADGTSNDYFGYPNYSENPPSNSSKGDKIFGPLTHIYSITDTGGTGGNIGCKVQTFTSIYYYTYGITGNGF